jgi:thioredoxin 1
MGSSQVVYIKGDNWKTEVIDSTIPVLVDFWAEWCGPCKMISPILDEVSGEMAGQVKIAKVNVDENRDLAAQFNIRSIPTLLVLKDGQVKGQMIGAMSKAMLKEKLGAYL